MKTSHSVHIVIVAAVIFVSGVAGAQQPPPLAELKAAAEKGDGKAQAKFGDAYRFNDPGTALEWYRKAGTQGVAHAQCEAGRILLGFAGSWSAKPEVRAAHGDEGIYWLVKAANQGVRRAQVDLGRQYERGKFIKENQVEAYKWFALAAQGDNLFDSVGLEGKWARDALILQMTQAQIAEGQKRVAAFAPGRATAEMPEPAWVDEIKLQGISGSGRQGLVTINGQTFQQGEERTVKVGEKNVKVRCVEVRQGSALVAVEGIKGERELKLIRK